MRRRPGRNGRRNRAVSLFGVLTVATALMSWPTPAQLPLNAPVDMTAASVPTPAHVVIVVEENRSQSNIIGNKAAPYINQLAANGAMMAQSFAEVHPSEPNYYALFAGNTLGHSQRLSGQRRQHAQPRLAIARGRLHVRRLRGKPARSGLRRMQGGQIRAQARAVGQLHQYPRLALASVLGVSGPVRTTPACRPSRWSSPTSTTTCTTARSLQGDQWLYQNLSQYAAWAKANNSLLILTWDEDDNNSRNQIPTVFYGANVRPGTYDETISHYNVLSTLEQMYGLPKLGYATRAPAITDIWGA